MIFAKSNEKKDISKEERILMREMGKRIAEARKAKKITQAQLAEQLNVSFQAVSNWERGETTPDLSNLLEISRILEISIDALMGNDKYQPKKEEPVKEEKPVEAAQAETVEAPCETKEESTLEVGEIPVVEGETEQVDVNVNIPYDDSHEYEADDDDEDDDDYDDDGEHVDYDDDGARVDRGRGRGNFDSEFDVRIQEIVQKAMEKAMIKMTQASTRMNNIHFDGRRFADEMRSAFDGESGWRGVYPKNKEDKKAIEMLNRGGRLRDLGSYASRLTQSVLDRLVKEKIGDGAPLLDALDSAPYMSQQALIDILNMKRGQGAEQGKINRFGSYIIDDRQKEYLNIPNMRNFNKLDKEAYDFVDRGGRLKDLGRFAPGMTKDALDKLVMDKIHVGAPLLDALDCAPYMSQRAIVQMLQAKRQQGAQQHKILAFAKFIESDSDAESLGIPVIKTENEYDKKALYMLTGGGRMADLAEYAPNMTQSVLDKLVEMRCDDGAKLTDALGSAPYMSKEALRRVLRKKSEIGVSIYDIAQFGQWVDKDVLIHAAHVSHGRGATACKIMDALAPYVDLTDEEIESNALQDIKNGSILHEMLPLAKRLSRDTVKQMAEERYRHGGRPEEIISCVKDLLCDEDKAQMRSQLEKAGISIDIDSIPGGGQWMDYGRGRNFAQRGRRNNVRRNNSEKLAEMSHDEIVDKILSVKDMLDSDALIEMIEDNLDEVSDITTLIPFFDSLDEDQINDLVCDVYDGPMTWDVILLIAPYVTSDALVEHIMEVDGGIDVEELWELSTWLDDYEIAEVVNEVCNIDTFDELKSVLDYMGDEDEFVDIVCESDVELTSGNIVELAGMLGNGDYISRIVDEKNVSVTENDLVAIAALIDGDYIVDIVSNSDAHISGTTLTALAALIDGDYIVDIVRDANTVNLTGDDLVSLAGLIDGDYIVDIARDANTVNFTGDNLVSLAGLIDGDHIVDIAREADISITGDDLVSLARLIDGDFVVDLVREADVTLCDDDVKALASMMDTDDLIEVLREANTSVSRETLLEIAGDEDIDDLI